MPGTQRGRTVQKWIKFYIGGYDFTGYINSAGVAAWDYDTPGLPALDDAVRGGLPNQAMVSLGEVKGIFDNTASSGLHAVLAAGAGSGHIVTVAVGVRIAPTVPAETSSTGYPVFTGRFNLDQYREAGDDGMLSAMLKFGARDAGSPATYDEPWGVLLNNQSRAIANTSAGPGNDGLGATTAGGYMVYHVTGSAGGAGVTATISVDDSADQSTWLALASATTGSIDVSTKPSGIVALSKTATVREYLRWQLALGTASSVNFVLSFVRGR